jgi:hypothetical protein
MEEYKSIMKNDVWDIVLRPKGKSVATSKWIYKIKHIADGSIEKYKCNVPDLASLGNAANVCVGSKVYNI